MSQSQTAVLPPGKPKSPQGAEGGRPPVQSGEAGKNASKSTVPATRSKTGGRAPAGPPRPDNGSSAKQQGAASSAATGKSTGHAAESRGDAANPGLVKANLLALGTLFFLSIAVACLALYAIKGKVEVIATTEDGRIIKSVPLPVAFVTEPRVLSFADECLRDSFSHDFENYRRTMNYAKGCYTSEGGKAFDKAIEPTLLDIRQKRLVLSVTTEPPTIVRGPMLVAGRATWEVQSVLTLYYQGTRERFPAQQRLATMTIVRVPLEENLRAVSIDAIQLRPYVKTQ